MWDFHESDVLVDQHASLDPHLTVLDVFMKPSELLGANPAEFLLVSFVSFFQQPVSCMFEGTRVVHTHYLRIFDKEALHD
eukprot:s3492_g1.t1